jgi:hypothetical protein
MVESVSILSLLKNANEIETSFAQTSKLSWLKRRRLGLTWNSIKNAVEELQKSGVYDEDMSHRDLAKQVSLLIVQENLDEYCKLDASFDWEQIIAFIEKILPLILMIIQIFGAI